MANTTRLEPILDTLTIDDVTRPAVYVLAISHRHGTNISVFTTEEKGYEALDEFVKEWWDTEITSEQMPDDRDGRISRYFELVDESYELEISPIL